MRLTHLATQDSYKVLMWLFLQFRQHVYYTGNVYLEKKDWNRVQPLGSGGYGSCYVVRDNDFQMPMALKMCVSLSLSVCAHVYMCVRGCGCGCVCAYVHVCFRVCVCMCVCIYVLCTHVCLFHACSVFLLVHSRTTPTDSA